MMDAYYADGGEATNPDDAKDNEMLMDHCALEMMHAVDTKDKAKFLEGFNVLVADVLNKMSSDEDEEK